MSPISNDPTLGGKRARTRRIADSETNTAAETRSLYVFIEADASLGSRSAADISMLEEEERSACAGCPFLRRELVPAL